MGFLANTTIVDEFATASLSNLLIASFLADSGAEGADMRYMAEYSGKERTRSPVINDLWLPEVMFGRALYQESRGYGVFVSFVFFGNVVGVSRVLKVVVNLFRINSFL